jgi:hypothetical protein
VQHHDVADAPERVPVAETDALNRQPISKFKGKAGGDAPVAFRPSRAVFAFYHFSGKIL